ncbi:MAG: trimethylamine methyltransferase, partial [bacterium]|nr:trimethylamine methyltransferase [bacterium]
RGIEVNEDTLATDVIHDVGPGGQYLQNEHTQKHYKTEFWHPNLCDRNNYDKWAEGGKKPMRDRVIKRVHDILSSHKPSAIKPETEVAIREVMEAAEDRERSKE